MPLADLRDCRIAYEIAGTSGTPVVLIMGLMARGNAWRNQIPALARRHRVVSFDNRGVGKTASRPALIRLSRFADDTAGLLDHLGWEDAHVVGVSMGGMIAQELALRHRARIRSLALIATHAGGLRNLLPPLRGMRLFLEAQLGGKSRRIAALERLLFPDDYLARCDRAAVLESLRADFGGAIPLAQRLTQLGAAFRHEGRRLHELASVPTLIVRPGQDVLIRPRESDRLHRLIPGSRLVRIDEAGHGVIRQCAGRLNELLLEHFRLRDEAEPLFAAGG